LRVAYDYRFQLHRSDELKALSSGNKKGEP